jgi:hypothetical protein
MKIEPFLNRNIIIDKSANISIEINKPKFEKIVLNFDRDYETTTGYFTILYVNNEYKLYYRSCPYPYYKDKTNKTYYSTEELAEHEYFCLATSKDGLNFEKKSYDIINYNNSTDNNILMHDYHCCHNFYPFYDKKNNKFLAVSGTAFYGEGLHLFESFDGISWIHIKKILDESHLLGGWLHRNHFDTLNCIVYNEKEDYYYIYIRHNKGIQRFVQYTKTNDFNNFIQCKEINILDNNDMILYTPGIFKYENSDYFISVPTEWRTVYGENYDNKNNSTLMVSNDGINFNILTKELFKENSEIDENNVIDKNCVICKMNINSIVSSPDNKKMYIYSHCISTENDYIYCHSFKQNRIQKITSNWYGFIKTQLIRLCNKLIINYDTFEEGYLSINILNKDNEVVLESTNMHKNHLDYEVIWKDNKILEPDEYYIKFNMYNCNLYSISYD